MTSTFSSNSQRLILLDSVKSNPKDLDAWARLIRFDADAACALGSSTTAYTEAWKAVDRLSSQAFLANKDSVKLRPLAYISFTIDQARAQMRISGAATAKKVLRSVASLPEVKSSWPFYRTLALLEAMQGDPIAVKRVLDMCREKMVKQGGSITDEFESFDETLRHYSSSTSTTTSESDTSFAALFSSKFSIDAVQLSAIAPLGGSIAGLETTTSSSSSTASKITSLTTSPPILVSVVPLAPSAPSSTLVSKTLASSSSTAVPPPPPPPPSTTSSRASIAGNVPAARRMSLMRTSFISSLSPVAENKVSRRSIAPSKSTHPSTYGILSNEEGGGGGGDDMDVSGDDATTVVSGASAETTRSSNNTTSTTTLGGSGGGVTTTTNTLFNSSAATDTGLAATMTKSSSSTSLATSAVSSSSATVSSTGNGSKKASTNSFVIPDYIRDFKANPTSSSSSSFSSSSTVAQKVFSVVSSSAAVSKKDDKISNSNGVNIANPGGDVDQTVVILQPRGQRQQQQQQQQQQNFQSDVSNADTAVTSSISPHPMVDGVEVERGNGGGPTIVFQPRNNIGNGNSARVSAGSSSSSAQQQQQQQQQRVNHQRQQEQQQQQQESLDESSFDEGETVAPPQPQQQQQQRISNSSNKAQVLHHQQQQQQQQTSAPTDTEYHSPSPLSVFGSLGATNEVVRVGQHNYLRLACIGRGGSSRVYRVLGEDMNLYALKRVRLARMDHASVDVYKNEINLMKRLAGNRHIIKLIDAEVAYESRCIHMVMECGQADLNSLLQNEQERAHSRLATEGSNARIGLMVDENQLRLVWQQMLEAVQTIHEARIVHGDLKPANFVFVEGVLKLIDFGIAKAISNDTTNIVRDSQVGTINYMSPEAIMDTSSGGKFPTSSSSSSSSRAPVLKQGRASDIWSLGCILYQMAYGKTPFADLSLIHKLHSICDPTYSIHFADCGSPALVQVLQSCLQRDPSKRPPILDADRGGLLNHPFLRPHLSPHTSNQATRMAIDIIEKSGPGEAVVLSRDQLNKALVLAGSLGAERAVAPFVAPSEVPIFVEEACARIADELLALGEPGAGTELPTGLKDELKAAARKPSSPIPAALKASIKVMSQVSHTASNNSVMNGSTSTRSQIAPPPPPPLPTISTAVSNLQEAIASKAATLRHVDKENLVKPSNSSSGGDHRSGGNGLLAAMRKGLNDKFAHARPIAVADTSILDVTGTWGMPT